jgi:maleate cis-trans isomerase
MTSEKPLVGFLSPPDWHDPSPAEFLELCGHAIRIQQYTLALPAMDWSIEAIAASEPEQLRGVKALATTGCDVIALVGTPFGWAGLNSLDEARARAERLCDATGVPVITTGVAIIEALQALGVSKVGLACTYYPNEWKRAWSEFVTAAGFKVSAHSFIDDGIMPKDGKTSAEFWNPAPQRIVASVHNLLRSHSYIEAVVISGAGARTLALISDLESELGVPVMGSDTALYCALGKHLNLELALGSIGKQ